MEIKNVVFDLGGVVVDWNPERLMQEYPGDPEMPVALFKNGFFRQCWPEYDRGMVDQVQIVRQMSAFAERHYAECWDFVEFVKHSLRDIPETVQLIRELAERGYRLFCLSNMSSEFYDYLREREVFRYFEGQIISAREKIIKPEEAIYRLLLERYDLQPEETLFIDDLEKNVEAAHCLGIQTVHFADKAKGMHEIRERLRR